MSNKPSQIMLSLILRALTQLRIKGIVRPYTAQIIAECKKCEYLIDYGTPVARSVNAAYGRFLKKHEVELGIFESTAKQRYRAADGGKTTCSIWTI